MVRIYHVTGMTCNGCKNAVENALNQLSGITNAEVSLEASEVTIEMPEKVSISELKKAVPKPFTISELEVETTTISKLENNERLQLYPLFLIFSYITVAAILLHYSSWNIGEFMLDFMGLFYIVFSFFKFLDFKGFPKSFKMYDPLAKVLPIYARLYPFIETSLGILFLMRIQIPLALIITLIILGVTTIGVTKTLLGKKSIQCACLGTALKLPMTKATFIENSIMIIMAITMLYNIYK